MRLMKKEKEQGVKKICRLTGGLRSAPGKEGKQIQKQKCEDSATKEKEIKAQLDQLKFSTRRAA